MPFETSNVESRVSMWLLLHQLVQIEGNKEMNAFESKSSNDAMHSNHISLSIEHANPIHTYPYPIWDILIDFSETGKLSISQMNMFLISNS